MTNGAEPTADHREPYQLLPPLAPEVLAQLEASIRERGVEDPIVVDEAGNTLDGHHRRMIAERLGIPYENRVVAGLSEDEKRLYAIRRNTERRQLSKAQRALVGMRAEPSFRVEAKARQGARTDLWTDSAKSENQRRWAAGEAAQLVGLPLTTYKEYRRVITEMQKELGAETVDALIELGTWDIAELRAQATERGAERRRLAEAAAASGETTGESPLVMDARFVVAEASGGDSSTGGDSSLVIRPEFTFREARPQPQALDDGWVFDPKIEEWNHLSFLQKPRLNWYAQTDPQRLASRVVANWGPSRVAELRDGVRLLSSWLTALDAALSEAQLHPPAGARSRRAGPRENVLPVR